MDRRSVNPRGSSLRDVSAFSESFSCGEFGAYDLDLDEEDYEAMAAEAELKARERINKSKARDTVFDGLLEGDGDVDVSSADVKVRSDHPRPPPRGGAGLASMKNAPQSVEDKEGGQSSASLASQNDKGSALLGGLNQYSGEPLKGGTSFSNQDNIMSEMVLASAPNVGPGGGIHINAPNVTINYIIEQRGESKGPPRIMGTKVSDMSKNGDWRDGSSRDAKSKGEGGEAKQGSLPMHTNESSVHENNPPEQPVGESEATKRVTPDSAPHVNGGIGTVNIKEHTHTQRSGSTGKSANISKSMTSKTSKSLSEMSRPEATKATMPSEPYDLSALLDSLWSPENPNPKDKSNTTTSRSTCSSESSGSGVYTAGYSSFHSGQFDQKNCDMTKGSKLKQEGGKVDAGGGVVEGQSREPAKKQNMRDLLATMESEKSLLSVYEDASIDGGCDPTPRRRNQPLPKMGVIAENSDCASASVSEGTDPEISEFARDFVRQLSKSGDKRNEWQAGTTRRASLDSLITLSSEERSAASPAPERPHNPSRNRRSSAIARMEFDSNKVRPRPGLERKIERTRSAGSAGIGQLKNDINHQGNQLRKQGKSNSERLRPLKQPMPRPLSKSLPANSAYPSDVLKRHDDANASRPRPSGHSRRRSDGHRSSKVKNYTIGDRLRSENDILHDATIGDILRLEPSDCAFVRRSGGTWTFAVVSEVSENGLKFLLDKSGSKKKLERHVLVQNVRLVSKKETMASR